MLKSIKAVNFLSWKQLHFKINDGVTLIDGWNEDDQTSEGSGKSAIFNALCWGIYGKVPKDIKIDDVIKNGQKGCAVQLEFDKFIIVRSRKPNQLYAIVNGEQKMGKDAKETQVLIEELVGLSYEAFCQTVYFAQNTTNNFLLSNQEDKAKILSEIQDLKSFDKARSKVMEDLKIQTRKAELLHQEYKDKLNDSERILAKITHIEEMYDEKVKSYQDKKDTIKKYIYSKLTEITSIEVDMLKLTEFVANNKPEDLSKFDDKKDELLRLKAEANLQVQNHDKLVRQKQDIEKRVVSIDREIDTTHKKVKKLAEFLENPQKECPTCGSVSKNIDLSDHKAEYKALNESIAVLVETRENVINTRFDITPVDSLLSEIDTINKKLQKIRDEEDKIKTNNRQIDSAKSNIASFQNSIKKLNNQMTELGEELEELNNNPVPSVKNKIKELEDTLYEAQNEAEVKATELRAANELCNRLEVLKDSFKEVKTFVFNSVLTEINKKTNAYASNLFEVPITVKFENESMKINTEILYNNTERSLGLLSGGQTQRLNLATDLALSDVVSERKNNKVGVLIIDEYMKNLSESSMEKCLSLLKSRKNPVLLIEHNSIFKSIIDNEFQVVLQDGTSRSVV